MMENSWKCPKCGAENHLKFCASCGFERKEIQKIKEQQEKQQKTADILNSLFNLSESKEGKPDKNSQYKESDVADFLVPNVIVDDPQSNETTDEQVTYNSLKHQKEQKQKANAQTSASKSQEKDSVSSFLSAVAKQQQAKNSGKKNEVKPQVVLNPETASQGVLGPQKETKYLSAQESKKEIVFASAPKVVDDSAALNENTHDTPKIKEEFDATTNVLKDVEKSDIKPQEPPIKDISETNIESSDHVDVRNEEKVLEQKSPVDTTEEKENITPKETEKSVTSSDITDSDYFGKYDNKTARDKIRELSVSPEMEIKLQTILFPHVRGFRYVFLGNAGSKKDAALKEIAKVMYGLGKIKEPKCNHIAFHEIPDIFDPKVLYVIEDLSAAVANLFNFDDLSTSSTVTQEEYKKRMNALISAGNTAYIILNTNNTEIKGFMPIDPRLGFVFQKSEWIDFPELSNEEITDAFLEYLPEFHKNLVTPSFRDETISYLERNRRYFPFNNYELASYLATQASLSEVLTLPPEKHNSNTLSKSFENIIGMKIVKDQINELNQYLVARAKLEAMGAKLPNFNLHMMFLGNPGVGKTTIARIIAKLLFDLGYIKEDKLIEVASNDLIGVHGNETGIKTNKVIMSALGGVLFVDEAYSLSQSCGAAGLEAIATLVKCMEDYKENLVCMFAGYSKEMDDFTRSNSGIASRINYIFEFEDYTPQELYDIFELKLNRMGLSVSPDAKETLFKVTKFGAGRRNFGNGRYVDKLLQRSLTKHGLLDLPKEKMLVLQKESIPTVEEIMKSFGRFSA